ncbi:MAG TPA: transketolase C-terminal domain-containing protein [Hyphomicrobiaceae bacterium]|nr:transketolase C-terminal domain-containing protein [Hyphomicrobiaceae bacterium]
MTEAAATTLVEAARLALRNEMRRNPNIVVLGEDVCAGGIFGQYKGLVDEFGPKRIVDTPIAEATMVGAAVGAALVGLRPVVETRFSDFALSAMDEIVNQAAKMRYMFGGQGRVPIVIRMPSGLRHNSAAQHSQSLEACFAHIPGLVVTAPASPADARGLLLAALRCNDPVIHMESKELWQLTGDLSQTDEAVPLGVAQVVRRGSDATIVAWSNTVREAMQAAADLERLASLSIEVIDLRTLWPWDRQLVKSSANRTKRLVIAHESVRDVGLGAEIAATIAEELHGTLLAPVRRVASPRIPVGYSPPLEEVYRVRSARIVKVVAELVGVPLPADPNHRDQEPASSTRH